MRNALESSKWFPYMAWTLVISFSLFTYLLSVHIQIELQTIQEAKLTTF